MDPRDGTDGDPGGDPSGDVSDARSDAPDDSEPDSEPDDELDDDELDDDELDEAAAVTETAAEDTGIGAGAAAVVSAALGAVALTGTWTGKVVSERETLVGQISTSQGGSTAQQISEIYGDAWHSTALVNGLFALLALIVALVVLTLPRRPGWVRAVAAAGAVLGGLGLLLSVGTYFDLFLSLPTAGS
ncbi:membrane protein [Streptomyces viridochromogenes]|uniref:Membrane protein n=1 Tax=Streptomyces viridochromogenes TaxID=1938 RepID=A0A0L8L3E2_STRVR|nr:membrane protein [Streptomyces viridochromogenes]